MSTESKTARMAEAKRMMPGVYRYADCPVCYARFDVVGTCARCGGTESLVERVGDSTMPAVVSPRAGVAIINECGEFLVRPDGWRWWTDADWERQNFKSIGDAVAHIAACRAFRGRDLHIVEVKRTEMTEAQWTAHRAQKVFSSIAREANR